MIALDTNVVVRILMDDDPEQGALARRLVERALDEGAALFVPLIVVCETVWVLETVYRVSRGSVAEAVSWLLTAEQLQIERQEEVARALTAYAGSRADLADILIRERARTHGAQAVATFDRSLDGLPGFVSPDAGTCDDDLSLREAPPPYRLRGRLAAARR